MRARNYKLNVLAPLIIAIIGVSTLVVVVTYLLQESAIIKQKVMTVPNFNTIFEKEVAFETEVLNGYLSLITKEKTYYDAFAANDRKRLYELAEALFKELSRRIEVTHFYFMKADGEVLLRVHDLERYGDIVQRYTFKKAQDTGQPVAGLEFGIKKNYTLRAVHPWIIDGELVGYIELGKEVDKLIGKTASTLNTEIYLAINKEVYQDVPDFVAKRLENSRQTENHYIMYQTFRIPEEIEAVLKQSNGDDINILFEGRKFYLFKSPLTDVSNKNLGYFVFLVDSTLEYQIMYAVLRILLVVVAGITLILIFAGRYVVKHKEEEVNKLTEQLEKLAVTDTLTGLYNRKYFDEVVPRELQKARRNKQFVTMFMMDLDHFKEYNDYYGHHAGDDVLRKVSATLRETCQRSGDLLFRMGGEEFAILFVHHSKKEVCGFAEEIRRQIRSLDIVHDALGEGRYLTISLGAVTCLADENISKDRLYKQSDTALYRAKELGRNRVECYEEEP